MPDKEWSNDNSIAISSIRSAKVALFSEIRAGNRDNMYFLPVIVGKSSVILNKNVQDVWRYRFLYVLLPMKAEKDMKVIGISRKALAFTL